MKVLIAGCYKLPDFRTILEKIVTEVEDGAEIYVVDSYPGVEAPDGTDIVILASCRERIINPENLLAFETSGGVVVTLPGICYKTGPLEARETWPTLIREGMNRAKSRMSVLSE